MLGAEENVKEYFNAIHNEFSAFKKVNDRFSFKYVSYRHGRKLLAKVSLHGKSLKLHLALDVNEFEQNVYHQKFNELKTYQEVPFTVKVKSERGKKNAIKLINALMEKRQIK